MDGIKKGTKKNAKKKNIEPMIRLGFSTLLMGILYIILTIPKMHKLSGITLSTKFLYAAGFILVGIGYAFISIRNLERNQNFVKELLRALLPFTVALILLFVTTSLAYEDGTGKFIEILCTICAISSVYCFALSFQRISSLFKALLIEWFCRIRKSVSMQLVNAVASVLSGLAALITIFAPIVSIVLQKLS